MNQQELLENLRAKILKMEIHDRDYYLDNSIKLEKELIDISILIQEEEAKNKPPPEIDPKKQKENKAKDAK